MSPLISRRHLIMTGAVAASAATWGGLATRSARAADVFDELRQRWVDYLTGGSGLDLGNPVIAARVRALSDSAAGFVASAGALTPNSAIWSDLPLAGPNPGNIALTYSRVLTVATAWATPGTAVARDAAVGQSLVAWYRHLSTYWYNLTVPKAGNWWFWEIGIPRTLGDLSALVDGLLTDADRAAAVAAIRRFTPNPNWRGTGTSLAETGGNRADKVLACLLRGIAARSEADMVLARDAMSDVVAQGRNSLFSYATSGNGFYRDGSYIDHSYLPYVGTYGNVALAGVARSLLLTSGSPWQVTDPNVSVILDAPAKSFAPFIWNGRMVETVRGRAVSRENEPDFRDGFSTVASLLLMAPALAEPYRTSYRAMAKGWLQRCTADVIGTSSNIGDISRALAVLGDGSVTPATEPAGHVRTGAQERMVHRGEGWAFTVATSSSRIGRFEWGNNENNLGWHQGDGAAYLYVTGDEDQFSANHWPTVDPYRLPGTTASLQPRSSGASGAGTGIPRAANAWGGGVVLANRWGTAGMDLTNELRTVRAKKSWFALDDLVIALGSDVAATTADAVTVVENRGLTAGGRLLLDGAPVTGSTHLSRARWAHVANGTDVAGYVFVGRTALDAAVVERSGTWYDVNSGADTAGSQEVKRRSYATMTIPHAAGTSGGSYGYVTIPGVSAAQTARLARDLSVSVVRQDAAAHIVEITRNGNTFVFAHLFSAVSDGPIQATGPVAVLLQRHGNEASFAVSSPTRSLTAATLVLDFGRPFSRVVSADERLQVSPGKVVTVQANLAVSGGLSFEASLAG